KTLDDAVASFHKRRLTTKYKAVLFDAVVLSRKTGAGAVKRPVLTALGIRPDGKKEVIDWRLCAERSRYKRPFCLHRTASANVRPK
ncbi:MAG TPA: transposase, partial [Polyangia bacterium]